jgi:antitoxin HicB
MNEPAMLAYPAIFTKEKRGITVTFPDFPEAVTCGYSKQEAMEFAIDALEVTLSEYVKRLREIPKASQPHGRNCQLVVLPALAEAKLQLYEAMRRQHIRKAALARRIGWQRSQVDRLLDLSHDSRLGQLEQASRGLNKRLVVKLVDEPGHPRR